MMRVNCIGCSLNSGSQINVELGFKEPPIQECNKTFIETLEHVLCDAIDRCCKELAHVFIITMQ